jgi:hypothetical protein
MKPPAPSSWTAASAKPAAIDMRLLPKNICTHPDGFLVRVERAGVLFQAFINKKRPDALERATILRDRFLAKAGAVQRPKSRRHNTWARSNTGVPGISETVQFNGTRAYPCFNVSWGEQGRQRCKRFRFGRGVDRETALAQAITHRRLKAGVAHV